MINLPGAYLEGGALRAPPNSPNRPNADCLEDALTWYCTQQLQKIFCLIRSLIISTSLLKL